MSDTNDMPKDFVSWVVNGSSGIPAGTRWDGKIVQTHLAAWQAATERASKVCENKRVEGAHDTDEFQVGYNMGVNDCAVAIRQGGDT